MKPQIRKVMPSHPGSSIDYDEAVASWKKIAEEDRQRRLRRKATGIQHIARPRKRPSGHDARNVRERWRSDHSSPGEPMELQIRKVMPPHPGASITVEQAIAAFAAVEEEQMQERLRRNAARRAAYRAKKAAAAREP